VEHLKHRLDVEVSLASATVTSAK